MKAVASVDHGAEESAAFERREQDVGLPANPSNQPVTRQTCHNLSKNRSAKSCENPIILAIAYAATRHNPSATRHSPVKTVPPYRGTVDGLARMTGLAELHQIGVVYDAPDSVVLDFDQSGVRPLLAEPTPHAFAAVLFELGRKQVLD